MENTTVKDIQDIILTAVDEVVSRRIDQATFDKTISAIIVEQVKKQPGYYKVKYQDATYYASVDDIKIEYPKGTEVYILIPGGDFSKNKKIIGSVKELGTDYIKGKILSYFRPYGNNCVPVDIKVDINAGPNGGYTTLYKKDDINNPFQIDNEELKEYIEKEKLLCVSGVFKLEEGSLDSRGNYGIKIVVKDIYNETKTCVFDTSSMLGDPWDNKDKYQEIFFTIDPATYEEITEIYVFNEDINSLLTLTDFKLRGGVRVTDEQLLTLSIDVSSNELAAKVSYDGNRIYSNIEYYWFRENAEITSSKDGYNNYGGECWYLLDEKTDILKLIENSNLPKIIRYKCVVVYNKEIILTSYAIANNAAGKNIYLKASSDILNSENKDYTITCIGGTKPYKWKSIDENKNASSYEEETSILKISYNTLNTGENIFFCLTDGVTVSAVLKKEDDDGIVYLDTGYGEDKGIPGVDDENTDTKIDYGEGGYAKLDSSGCLIANNAKIQGDIYATNGYFSGELRAPKGTIGGWNIGAYRLASKTNNTDTNITKTYVYTLIQNTSRSNSFVAGVFSDAEQHESILDDEIRNANFRITQGGALHTKKITCYDVINLKSSVGDNDYTSSLKMDAKSLTLEGPKDIVFRCNGAETDDSRYSIEFIKTGIKIDGTIFDRGVLRPTSNSTEKGASYTSLGSPDFRYALVYTTKGVDTTSDRRMKKNIIPLEDKYIKLFDLVEPVSYERIKGDRRHTGFIAQDVEEAMKQVGLSSKELGFLCKNLKEGSSKEESNDYTYSLRYEEYIAIMAKKIKQLEQIILKQQEQIDSLK